MVEDGQCQSGMLTEVSMGAAQAAKKVTGFAKRGRKAMVKKDKSKFPKIKYVKEITQTGNAGGVVMLYNE